jgi:Family of unknown function (DUF6064)
MSEWWAYRPKDFLLFSPRVFWRMFELHNGSFWPLHLLTLAVGMAVAFLIFRQPRGHGLWIALLVGALWAFLGWSFLWNRYATINWAIAYVAPAFGLQAILLPIAAVMPGGLTFDRRGPDGWTGLMLVALGFVLYPLLPPLFGRSWAAAEVFGIAPDPTGITTLGLLLAARGRLVPLLFPIPLLWLLLSWLTLRTMGDPQAWLPLLAAVVALVALVLRRK